MRNHFKNKVLIMLLITACILGSSFTLLHKGSVYAETINKVEVKKDLRAVKIDNYFKAHNYKLAGYGNKFVEVADKYGLPYNLLPAISVAESSGGNEACRKSSANVFGWGSCKLTFKSYDEAIDHVGWALSGGLSYYKSKNIDDKLWEYNTKIVPTYTKRIKGIMTTIDNTKAP